VPAEPLTSATAWVYTALAPDASHVALFGPNNLNVTVPVGVPPEVAEIVAESWGVIVWLVTMLDGAWLTVLDSPVSPQVPVAALLLVSPCHWRGAHTTSIDARATLFAQVPTVVGVPSAATVAQYTASCADLRDLDYSKH
jgi:hypothetical protein